MIERAHLVVVAWGVDGQHNGRGEQMLKLLDENHVDAHALSLTEDGVPDHPVRLPGYLNARPYRVLCGEQAARKAG